MRELSSTRLGQACRIFLAHAYPGGEPSVPPAKRPYLQIAPDQSLATLLEPPVCQPALTAGGEVNGYALRLGCSHFPHLKLRVNFLADAGEWVFGVDTHDAVTIPAGHPDEEKWLQLRAANRRLKEEIESAWEAAGLMTFNDLLRRGLGG